MAKCLVQSVTVSATITLGKIELGELNNSDLLHRNVNSAVMTLCRCSGRVVKVLEAEVGIGRLKRPFCLKNALFYR